MVDRLESATCRCSMVKKGREVVKWNIGSIFLVLFLSVSVEAVAAAEWAQLSADEFKVSAPPEDGSFAHKRELDEMIAMQEADRTAACSLARRQKFPNFEAFFVRTKILTPIEAEKSRTLVSAVMNVTQKLTRKFKEYFARSRPFVLDSRIRPCADRPTGATSYPSSHASMAAAGSCVLAAIFPAKADKLRKYGLYIGDVRAIVGAHHPSDVKVGQNIGLKVCEILLADPIFKRDMKAIESRSDRRP